MGVKKPWCWISATMKSFVFRDIMPCSPVKVDRRFGGTHWAPSSEPESKTTKKQHETGRQQNSSTLKMEAVCCSETSIDFHGTTWRYIPKILLKKPWPHNCYHVSWDEVEGRDKHQDFRRIGTKIKEFKKCPQSAVLKSDCIQVNSIRWKCRWLRGEVTQWSAILQKPFPIDTTIVLK
jgi:hypothetical protein